jgi:two-component system cell cycle sensor histidine kinase/response regulator CckA
MKRPLRHKISGWLGCSIVLAILVALTLIPAAANAAVSSSRIIRVVMDDNYPPYIFKDSEGRLKGILIDQWRLWEQKTGIRAELSAMDWAEAQRRMQAGEFDVIDTIFRSVKREQIYDFTKPYARLDVPLYFRSEISGISDIRDLKGFAVGVKAGGNVIDVLKSHGITDLIEFNNYEAIVSAARDHKINVFTVEKPPAHYFLYKFGINDQFRETKPLYTGEFHRAVAKGNQALLKTIESGFAKISKAEYEEIEKRWYGAPILSKGQIRHLWMGSAVVVALLSGLFLWLWMLRRMVAQRTIDLQKSHRLLNKLSMQVPGALFQVYIYPDGHICTPYASEKLNDVYEVSPDQIRNDNSAIFDRFHPDDRNRIFASIAAATEKIAKWECEYRVILPRQGLKWLYGVALPEKLDDGTVTFYGIIMDITEQRMMQGELLKVQKLESIGILAGGIAHDFNNILTAIMGNISFARRFLDESHRSFTILEAAEKASKRAADLAHQLLTFAKGSEPIKSIVSAKQLVESSASIILRGSNVKCLIDVPDDLHAIIADEGQISQVFNNIIINAAQAMPGGGAISIHAVNLVLDQANVMSLAAGEYVRFTFTDTGCGISADDQKRIFDPYFTTKPGGNGLGLASAYSIINKHGGHISVRSEVGNGTTFDILLPASDQNVLEFETNSSAIEEGKHAGSSLLVMDDDEFIRELAADMLTELGYRVQTCASGDEAIAFYKASIESGVPFAAVIMDLTVPGGMGGKEAAQHILSMDPEARLIVSSGYSTDPVMAEYSRFGFSATIAKPYTAKDFSQTLNALLSASKPRTA